MKPGKEKGERTLILLSELVNVSLELLDICFAAKKNKIK